MVAQHTVDEVVERLDDSHRPTLAGVVLLFLAAGALGALELELGARALVLLWVPLVAGAASIGMGPEALTVVVWSVVVGVVNLPSGTGFGMVVAEVLGRGLGLLAVAVAARWIAGAGRDLATRCRVDGLTGLLNATGFAAAVERERQRALRSGSPITLVYVDLDGLKATNDRFGHRAGDVRLRRFAEHLHACRRTVDVAARLGGDEFALLLPATDADGASRVLSRLFATDPEHGPTLCASAGAVCWQVPPPTDEMIEAADSVMYRVKVAGGRSFTIVAGVEPDREAQLPGRRHRYGRSPR